MTITPNTLEKTISERLDSKRLNFDSSLPFNAAGNRAANQQLSEGLAQLLKRLPKNDLAVFGGEKVRSHPYPSWPISDARDAAAVTEVVQSVQWGGAPYPGPKTAEFAAQFARIQSGSDISRKPLSAAHAVLLMNGSLTMEVALKAAGIGWGDEVIVPAYTFQATAAAPISAGAIPVVVDIDPETYCISPAAVKAAITPKTRAIIPVHLGAQMADMDAVMAIAEQQDLVVIEDCAHAHGAQWNGRGAGTIGDFGSFSLQSSKLLTTGEGGILLCREQAMAERATSLIDCGRLPKAKLPQAEQTAPESDDAIGQLSHLLLQFLGKEETSGLGMNYRMTEFQAALGTVALARFEQQQQARSETVAYLESRLGEVPGVRMLKRDLRHTQQSVYRYIFAIEPEQFGATHEEVCLALYAEGIACSKGYSAIHRDSLFQPKKSKLPVPSVFGDRLNFEQLSLPATEQACEKEAIWLDECVFRAGYQGIDDVVEALKKVQRNAPVLAAAKQAFLEMVRS